ncbi:uncharacterized protein LOC144531987 [Sander vitreus]
MTAVDLFNTLEDLREYEFKQFKWYLQQQDIQEGYQSIKVSKLENAERRDTVDVMVKTFHLHGALKVTKKVLEKINRNDLVQSLPDTSSGPEGLSQEEATAKFPQTTAAAYISSKMFSETHFVSVDIYDIGETSENRKTSSQSECKAAVFSDRRCCAPVLSPSLSTTSFCALNSRHARSDFHSITSVPQNQTIGELKVNSDWSPIRLQVAGNKNLGGTVFFSQHLQLQWSCSTNVTGLKHISMRLFQYQSHNTSHITKTSFSHTIRISSCVHKRGGHRRRMSNIWMISSQMYTSQLGVTYTLIQASRNRATN